MTLRERIAPLLAKLPKRKRDLRAELGERTPAPQGPDLWLVTAVLALTGFALTIWWAVGFVAEWIHTGTIPLELNPRFWTAVGGVLLFIIAWFWSLATSLAILRAERSHH